eukprot:m.16902 g.16902  ORF g.16902 m.16902 type:complete len:65 (+) comp27187_c0_seq2:81-275(+)
MPRRPTFLNMLTVRCNALDSYEKTFDDENAVERFPSCTMKENERFQVPVVNSAVPYTKRENGEF